MRNQIAVRWARKPWLAALLLAAFCSRALVPVGFMPGQGGLVLCSGYAPVSHSMAHAMPGMDMAGMDMSGMGMAHHDGDAGPGGHGSDHQSMETCPFAAAASAMAGAQSPTATALTHFDAPDVFFPPQQFIPRGTIVPTRLPRGPPSNS